MHRYEIGVLITPEMAIEMINRGKTIQRSMKPNSIKAFVGFMQNNDWKYPNGQCLIFNSDGILCDGQNRLQAVIDSGISRRFDICYGIPQENVDTIDSGVSRTPKDLIVMKYKEIGLPIKYAAGSASALKYIVSWENGNIYGCGAGVVSMHVKSAESRHRNIFKSVKFIGTRNPWANKSVCIALHYLLSRDLSKKQKVDEFFNQFIDRTHLGKKDPAMILLNRLEPQTKNSKIAKRPQDHIAWILRTWEHHLSGNKITKFTIGDKLPQV